LLGSIPFLGNLFRSENRKRVKSNLMVFLRPVVMRTQQGGRPTCRSIATTTIRALQQAGPAGETRAGADQ
jgi:general secretion pathway protein D